MAKISKEQFHQIRQEFGDVASWAVWAPAAPDAPTKSGIDNINIFNDLNIIDILHNDFVIVALNISGSIERTFGNFHSDSSNNTDYKMRFAFENTPLWGSYMTDILKNISEVNSQIIAKDLKSHLEQIKKHTDVFARELELLSASNATIVTLGGLSDRITRAALSQLGMKNHVMKIFHYAHYISPDNYRAHVKEQLANLEN